MINIGTLASGATQIGRYALNRKAQQRAAEQKLTLEALKNEMWNRKLQQQTQQAEAQRQFLLKKYEFDKQAEIEKGKADLAKWNRLKDIEEGHFRETKKLEGIRALTEQNRSRSELVRTQKEKDQTLNELINTAKSALPKFTNEGTPVTGTGNKKLYEFAMEGIKQYGQKKLGFTEPKNNQTISPEMQAEYDQLINAGLDPQSALLLLQQNYSQQGMRNMPPQRVTPKGTQPTTKKESWKDYIQ